MVARLPKFIDPFSLADKNARIEGELCLTEFDRLAELLAQSNSNVIFLLNFEKQGKFVKVDGSIRAELALKCQRCLDSLKWTINTDINLGVIGSLEQVERLPQGVEPLVLAVDEKIALKDIIEDELLLNLPSVPKHEQNCLVAGYSGVEGKVEPDAVPTPHNPFSILADLKKTGDL
jgi:uncharacterized protein